jgi:alkylhydroperoxidase/carboxymuconolactone decarboxylase family protein YurZ
MKEPLDAIGEVMGRPPDEARLLLTEMYGDEIAAEVIAHGAMWLRPTLTERERSLVIVAALTSLGTLARLRLHVRGALNHGASREEIEEVILTMMVIAGHARATEAIEVAREVFAAQESNS